MTHVDLLIKEGKWVVSTCKSEYWSIVLGNLEWAADIPSDENFEWDTNVCVYFRDLEPDTELEYESIYFHYALPLSLSVELQAMYTWVCMKGL